MNPSRFVAPLARHRDLLPLLAEWFTSEWPDWYGIGGPGDVQADLHAFAGSEMALPVGMVAFERGGPVGVGALKAASIPGYDHLSPWVGAGYVLPACRGQGIGAALLAALVVHARNLGYKHVYCGTSTSESLLVRSGWKMHEHIQHAGKPLTIFTNAA